MTSIPLQQQIAIIIIGNSGQSRILDNPSLSTVCQTFHEDGDLLAINHVPSSTLE